MGWSAGRHVDHPCEGQISPWPASKVADKPTFFSKILSFEGRGSLMSSEHREKEYSRRRTSVQPLTCNIDLSRSFYYLFFSFVILELEPFVFKRKALGEKL